MRGVTRWARKNIKRVVAILTVAAVLGVALAVVLPARVSVSTSKGFVSIGLQWGTPVSASPGISFRAVGAYVSGTAALTPVIPAAQLTGDMMLCFLGVKPYSDTPTISNGWASLGYATDGTVAAGVDVGSMQTRVFWKIAVSDTETNPTITDANNNVSGAVIIVFQKGASDSWSTVVGAGNGDATAGTGFSVTVSTDVGHTTGDMVVGGASFRSESAVPTSSNSITITGCSLGTYTKSPATDLSTTSGGDMGMTVGYLPVNSGTSSAAPVLACTLAAAHTGSAYVVRLRVSVSEPSITVSPISYNFNTVAVNGTPSSTTTYFLIDNTSTLQTDQTISVTTSTWSGGVTWTHSDTATPNTNTAGLKANKEGTWGTGDVIVKYGATWNDIATNQPANTDYSFGLKLIAPTDYTDGVEKTIVVRITAAAG